MTDPLMTTTDAQPDARDDSAQAFDDPTPPSEPSVSPDTPTDLSAFDDEYDEVDAPSFDEIPDGKYQVRVQRVELDESQAGDPMLKWDLVVVSGASAGRHVFKNSVITQKSLPFVKGDLQTLGVVLPRFSELPNHLDDLLDQTLEITKRTKGEYANVYFNRTIEIAGDIGDEPTPF